MQKAYKDALGWLAARLKEPSTWHGLNVLLTAGGVALSPDKIQALVVIGSMISGMILVLTKEQI